MGWLDEVPRAGGLYIGGLHALYQKQELFQAKKISHILSVIDFDIYERGNFKEYTHLHVRLDDDPNENLLQYFPEMNKFLDDALSNGGRVFVHCAMGKSRSATAVCAFLMWKFGHTPSQALEQLCEGRPVCSPNPGFMEQLGVYHKMLQARDSTDSDRIYRDWYQGRFIGDWSAWDRRVALAKL